MPEVRFVSISQADGPTVSMAIFEDDSTKARITAGWRKLDTVLELLFGLVAAGDVIAYQKDDGEFHFRVSDQGYQRADLYLTEESDTASAMRILMVGRAEKVVLSSSEERVLAELCAEPAEVEVIAEHARLTKGQVLHALAVLRNLGLAQGYD